MSLKLVAFYSTRQTQGLTQMRVTRTARAFHTLSDCGSHVQQMRLHFGAHPLHTQRKRVYPFMRMHFTREANAFIVFCKHD